LHAEYQANNYGYILKNLNNPEFPEELKMKALKFLAMIDNVSNTMRKISDNAISAIMQDSILNTDLLKSWYEIVRTPIAKYLLAETYFFTGNYEQSDATLKELPKMFVFNELEIVEYNNYMNFHNFKKQLKQSERSWANLKDEEIYYLQTIAEANTGRSSSMAKGVLCFFYALCYEEEGINGKPPTPPLYKKEYEQSQSEMFEYNGYNLSIYPNPAQTEVFVTVNNSQIKINRVELYDLVGRQIQEQVFDKSHGTLPIEEFSNGIYIIKVHLSNGETVIKKLVKQQ